MNESDSLTQDCIVNYWKQDKEDVDEDANLLEFLGSPQENKSPKRKRSIFKKITIKAQEPSIYDRLRCDEQTTTDQSPTRLPKVHSEGRFSSVKPNQPVQRLSHNEFLEEGYSPSTQSPLLRGIGFTPEPQPIQRNLDGRYTKLLNPQIPENKILRHGSKKPSFNVGIPLHEAPNMYIDGTPETNSILKISDMLSDPLRKQSMRPSLPLINSGIHKRTFSYNQGSLRLNQFVDQEFPDMVESKNFNQDQSPLRRNIPMNSPKLFEEGSQSPNPKPKTWNEIGSHSPSILIKRDEKTKHRKDPRTIRAEIIGHSYPSNQEIPYFAGSLSGPKSLVKLPRLYNQVAMSNNSPGRASSIFQSDIPDLRYQERISPNLIERKLTRVGSINHFNPPESLVFRSAAFRQFD